MKGARSAGRPERGEPFGTDRVGNEASGGGFAQVPFRGHGEPVETGDPVDVPGLESGRVEERPVIGDVVVGMRDETAELEVLVFEDRALGEMMAAPDPQDVLRPDDVIEHGTPDLPYVPVII
jgi:hypothetical protein